MRYRVTLLCSILIGVVAAGASSPATRPTYPVAKTVDITDDYHGTKVADPYRWLEDARSPDTKAFIDAQNVLVRNFVDGPVRERLHARLTELVNYPRYSPPTRHGKFYTFNKNDGLQPQYVLYVTESLDAPNPRILIDPNALSADGTVALSGTDFTNDGSLLAYGVSAGGSDQKEIRVRDVATGKDLPDVLTNCKFASVAWKHDNSGFWYNKFPVPGSVPPEDQAKNNKLYWHQLGTPEADDKLVFTPDDPDLSASPSVTDDGEYLLLYLSHGSARKNRLYFAPANDKPTSFVKLFDAEDAQYSFIEHDGPVFYILTNLDAPRRKLVAVDTREPAKEKWKTIIPEPDGGETISSVNCVNDKFVVTSMRDAHEVMRVVNMDGSNSTDIELPALGSVLAGGAKRTDKEFFFAFSSFTYPSSIYRYDFGKLALWRKSEVKFDPEGYDAKQVFVTSKDGTKVPMFVVHKRGLSLDGNNPTILSGYGGFVVSVTPSFSSSRIAWLENGGVYCVANLRGGGEYGEAWHKSGMLEKKQNVFDDFISCAQWLIDNQYTSTKRLAIQGGSNGGLLVAACEVQRPDLFGAVLCHVPLTDMLRYQRFSVGRFWTPEYGDATKSAEQFAFIRAYSPLQNVKAGVTYPPTIIFTGDGDDRVVPLHARKFAAALQSADAGTNPILLRSETRAGHGGGKPTAKQIDESADEYAFLFRVFGMKMN